MLLPFLLAQAAPRDLTPKDAMARNMVYKPGEMLATSGLGSLGKHLLPRGDVELRYWGGFAWGTHIAILRRTGGSWTAMRLTPWSRKPPTPLPPPKSGWATFWRRAEALGIWTLPDDASIKDRKGYAHIDDGYSTLVEYQRDGVYRAYAYDNPQHQTRWRHAVPMAKIDAFVCAQFPGWNRP